MNGFVDPGLLIELVMIHNELFFAVCDETRAHEIQHSADMGHLGGFKHWQAVGFFVHLQYAYCGNIIFSGNIRKKKGIRGVHNKGTCKNRTK